MVYKEIHIWEHTGFQLRDTDIEDSINQKQRRNDESDTIDINDNDRYTDDFTDREVTDSVYL